MAKKHEPASTAVVDTAKSEVHVDHLVGRLVHDDDQHVPVGTEVSTEDPANQTDQPDRATVAEVLADHQLPDGGPPDDGSGLSSTDFSSLRDHGLTSALDRLTDLDPFGSPDDTPPGASSPTYGKGMVMEGSGTTSFPGAPVAVGSDSNFKVVDTGVGGGSFGGSSDIFGSSRQNELQQAEIEINSDSHPTAEHKDTDFLPEVTEADKKAAEEKALAPDPDPTVEDQFTDKDGNVVTVYDDGTITTLHPDGTMEYDDGNVHIVENPDGTEEVTDAAKGGGAEPAGIPDEDHQVVLPPAIQQMVNADIEALRALHPDTGPGNIDTNPDADPNGLADIHNGPVPDAHAEVAGALTNPGSPDNPDFDGGHPTGGAVPSQGDGGFTDPSPDADVTPQTDGPSERDHHDVQPVGVHPHDGAPAADDSSDDSTDDSTDDSSPILTPVDHVPDAFDHLPDHFAFADDDTPSRFEPIEPEHHDLVPDHHFDLDD